MEFPGKNWVVNCGWEMPMAIVSTVPLNGRLQLKNEYVYILFKQYTPHVLKRIYINWQNMNNEADIIKPEILS